MMKNLLSYFNIGGCMKKFIIFLLTVLLSVSFFGCEKTQKNVMEGYTWAMTSVQSQNGNIVACAPSDETFYRDVYPIEMTCIAQNGSFCIVDKTHNQSYNGIYTVMSYASETTVYEIAVGEKSGTAVVSTTNYQDETALPTMVLSIDDYTLYFQSK